jgi:hypothetical protein
VGRLIRLATRTTGAPAGSAIKDVLAGKTAGFIKRVGPYERAVSRLKMKKDGYLGDKIQSLEIQIQELTALTRWQAGLPIIIPSEDEMSSGSEGEGEEEEEGADMASGHLDDGHEEALHQPSVKVERQSPIKDKRQLSIKIERQLPVKAECKHPIKVEPKRSIKVECPPPSKVERQPSMKIQRQQPNKVKRQPSIKE